MSQVIQQKQAEQKKPTEQKQAEQKKPIDKKKKSDKEYCDGMCFYCLTKKLVRGLMCKDCKIARSEGGYNLDLARIMYANVSRLIFRYRDEFRPINTEEEFDAALAEIGHLKYLRHNGIRVDTDPDPFNDAVITYYQDKIEELEKANDELDRENKIFEGENDEMREELYTYRNEKDLTELEEKLKKHCGDRVVLNMNNIELLKPYLEYAIYANLNYHQMMASKALFAKVIIKNYKFKKEEEKNKKLEEEKKQSEEKNKKLEEEKNLWLEEKKKLEEEKKKLEEEKKQLEEENRKLKDLYFKTLTSEVKSKEIKLNVISEHMAGMTPDLPE